MCVLYVSFGSNVRPRTVWCVAMGSAVLFILRSRLLLYYAGSGVKRVAVVLSVFSVVLCCYVLNMLVGNASPRGPMCFRCLMFNLSGPYDLLCLLCFIASWT